METYWTVNEEKHGYSIEVERAGLVLVGYSLPVTSHSGAGMTRFSHSEYSKGSSLYNRIKGTFGTEIADEVLHCVQNLDKVEKFKKENSYEEALFGWINSIPEDQSIPTPGVGALSISDNTYGNIADLIKIGAEVKTRGSLYDVHDAIFKSLLFTMKADNSVYFGATKVGARVVSSRTELFIVKVISGGLKTIKPLENWQKRWDKNNSELSKFYMYADYFVTLFKVHRIDDRRGSYLFKIDYDGNIIGKRKHN